MVFSTQITINFGETDPAGLVYFPNIFHYCHIAMERFFAEVCHIPYSKLIDDMRLGFPTVKIDAEFLTPMRHGDLIDIELTVSHIGNKSMSFSYKISNGQGSVCAKLSQVVVAMDLNTHRSRVIPDSIRETL
jgi:4-hydroxybenzoyl-CoA thioesterase